MAVCYVVISNKRGLFVLYTILKFPIPQRPKKAKNCVNGNLEGLAV